MENMKITEEQRTVMTEGAELLYQGYKGNVIEKFETQNVYLILKKLIRSKEELEYLMNEIEKMFHKKIEDNCEYLKIFGRKGYALVKPLEG